MKKLHYFLGVIIISSGMLFSSCDSSQQTASEEGAEDTIAVAEGMNNDLEDDTTTPGDRILFAVMSTRMQNALSQMAEQKASNPALKELSQAVIDTNETIIAMIHDLAEATDTQIPEVLSTDQQRVVDSLQELQPPEFDQAYLEVLVNDQQQIIENLQNLEVDAQSPIMQGLIDDIIDTEQPQLERIQAVQDEMM